MSHFHDEISKPISPDDNPEIEYIPSQIFTEYVRCLCKTLCGNSYDGIVYRSSLTGEKNVVLFYDCESSAEVLKLVKDPEELKL
ncbi:MAG: RES family NAD+ phosphorylase [Bacteroidales bacterium]|nr:RES family NAD+ phosphorylase [Bacteroidales bacterium]